MSKPRSVSAREHAERLREHARRAGRRSIKSEHTPRDIRVLADLLRVALDEIAELYEAEADREARDEPPAFTGSLAELEAFLDKHGDEQ